MFRIESPRTRSGSFGDLPRRPGHLPRRRDETWGRLALLGKHQGAGRSKANEGEKTPSLHPTSPLTCSIAGRFRIHRILQLRASEHVRLNTWRPRRNATLSLRYEQNRAGRHVRDRLEALRSPGLQILAPRRRPFPPPPNEGSPRWGHQVAAILVSPRRRSIPPPISPA